MNQIRVAVIEFVLIWVRILGIKAKSLFEFNWSLYQMIMFYPKSNSELLFDDFVFLGVCSFLHAN